MSIGPTLILMQLAFMTLMVKRARRSGTVSSRTATALLSALWVGLGGWSAITFWLGATGTYETDSFYALLPALWMSAIPFIVFMAPLLAFPSLRKGGEAVLAATPVHWLTSIQALRIAALGTAYKTHLGLFPEYFELAVGVPDLLFGVSALAMTWLALSRRVGSRALVIWHALGVVIIVPTAPVLLQLGLPGPLRVFDSVPTAEAVYAFPMALAPTMAVPTFVLLNLLAIWREVRKSVSPGQRLDHAATGELIGKGGKSQSTAVISSRSVVNDL